jgi:hypothetical protein
MQYYRIVEPHFGPLTFVIGAALLLAVRWSRRRVRWNARPAGLTHIAHPAGVAYR